MFRCKECQTEYEIKPDYCDCGNDTFDEIINIQEINQEPKQEKTEIKEIKQEIKDEPQTKKTKQTREEKEENIQIKEQISTLQNEIKQKKQSNISVFAWVIFAICIILSLVIILLPCKNTEETVTQEENKPVQEQTIPNINTFWDNSAPKNVAQNEEKIEENETQTKELTTQNKTEKINTKTSTPKTSQQKNSKTQTKSTKPKNTKSTASQQKQTTPKQNVANKQEIFNYKIQLRNNIAQKIDFTTVVGDGSCSFYFRVNKDGTITNKKAGNLSDNDSLNSTVYNALLRTNSFRTPPVGFDSTAVLKLFVKFQNNSYEVSLN